MWVKMHYLGQDMLSCYRQGGGGGFQATQTHPKYATAT